MKSMFSKEQRTGHDKRHKCSGCGATRFEKFMFKLTREFLGYGKGSITTRFGNEIWFCDKIECREKAKHHFNY